jgi:YbgC/YbaW family acyl-CoA thioester hydrolase
MPARPFVVEERARWGDVDLAGIVRWDAYTRFCEIGEAELFRAAGFPLRELYADLWLPRKFAHAEYVAPALLDDPLRIEVYLSNVGRTSITINYDVWSADRGTLHATAYQVLVCVTRPEFIKRELPAELRTALEPWTMSVEEARARQ